MDEPHIHNVNQEIICQTQYILTAAPFWPISLRLEGARATDEAAAAAATRILQKEIKQQPDSFSVFIIILHDHNCKVLCTTFYVHLHIHLFHLQSLPALFKKIIKIQSVGNEKIQTEWKSDIKGALLYLQKFFKYVFQGDDTNDFTIFNVLRCIS